MIFSTSYLDPQMIYHSFRNKSKITNSIIAITTKIRNDFLIISSIKSTNFLSTKINHNNIETKNSNFLLLQFQRF